MAIIIIVLKYLTTKIGNRKRKKKRKEELRNHKQVLYDLTTEEISKTASKSNCIICASEKMLKFIYYAIILKVAIIILKLLM